MARIYYGDIGTVLKVTTGYDFGDDTAATCDFMVMKPGDSTAETWDGTVSSVASEAAAGVVRHYIDSSAIDSTGIYHLQALVYAGDGTNQWYGQVTSFEIKPLWT